MMKELQERLGTSKWIDCCRHYPIERHECGTGKLLVLRKCGYGSDWYRSDQTLTDFKQPLRQRGPVSGMTASGSDASGK